MKEPKKTSPSQSRVLRRDGLYSLLRILTLTINVKNPQLREKYFYFIDVVIFVLLHLIVFLTLCYKNVG